MVDEVNELSYTLIIPPSQMKRNVDFSPSLNIILV